MAPPLHDRVMVQHCLPVDSPSVLSSCLPNPGAENGRIRLGGLGISRRFEVVQRQLATLPNGLREMQQVGAVRGSHVLLAAGGGVQGSAPICWLAILPFAEAAPAASAEPVPPAVPAGFTLLPCT